MNDETKARLTVHGEILAAAVSQYIPDSLFVALDAYRDAVIASDRLPRGGAATSRCPHRLGRCLFG
jgi:hypothetical protein